MAQMQTNGAAAHAAAETKVKRDALAAMFTPEEAALLKKQVTEDGGRLFAEALVRQATERPKIEIDDKGKLVPKDLDSVFRIARWIASLKLYGTKVKASDGRAEFVPYSEEECAAIIAAGRRLGMDPFYAMETIALINNKTCVFGRGIRGVLLASGLLEDWHEERIGFNENNLPGDNARVVITLKRKGMPTPIVGSFSVAQAKAAGLWATSGYTPWAKYPGDMLTWRAVGRASLGFSDVLGGMSVAEEVMDIEPEPEPRPAVNPKVAELVASGVNGAAGAGRETAVSPSASAPAPSSHSEQEQPKPTPPAETKPAPVTPTITPNVGTVDRSTKPRRGSQTSAADMLRGSPAPDPDALTFGDDAGAGGAS